MCVGDDFILTSSWNQPLSISGHGFEELSKKLTNQVIHLVIVSEEHVKTVI